jgi:hypothetical protein
MCTNIGSEKVDGSGWIEYPLANDFRPTYHKRAGESDGKDNGYKTTGIRTSGIGLDPTKLGDFHGTLGASSFLITIRRHVRHTIPK